MDKKTILIIDDSPDNLDILSEILKEEYKVKAALNGKIGLKIANTKPNLILLDILMPEMDGYEVFQKLKDNPETSSIPIVFISGNSNDDEIKKGMDMGASDYLFKPIDPELVLESVKKFLKD
ncbi:MAG: response regulator [Leptospiraceae bacterium]|nr:response regulator [Leptospiraceae bacterium]MCP5512840.1 response regulator [Leptospiraceae bacterium]